MRMTLALFLCVILVFPTGLPRAATEQVQIPTDTRVYVELKEEVIGKKKLVQAGQPVRAAVWRNVVIDGHIVVKAGTPVLVRVDELKKAKVAGIRGQLTLGAYETNTVDGQALQLSGGYNKKGKGKIAVAAALGGLLFLPLIFIRGKAAKLPVGTVFDANAVDSEFYVQIEADAAPRSVNLAGVLSDLRVDVLYNELEKQEKPKFFDFVVYAPADAPANFVIDRINEAQTQPIPLNVISRTIDGDEAVVRANVDIKTLAKRFTKGINRFDVAYNSGAGRVASEVVLDIQF